MVWSEGALLALARGDLGAAEAALERAWSFAVEVRDAGFSAHVRLTEVELAAYAGSAWPRRRVESSCPWAVATRWSSATSPRPGRSVPPPRGPARGCSTT